MSLLDCGSNQVCLYGGPRLTLVHFMAWLNLYPNAFEWEWSLIVDF